ncbi:ABC transporter permease [Actinomadura sp. DC4]|uniref:ABC transporter permease n=1 Tax=Actinomadura sp. DC4 TaxID=3055069 RepID=UPI0025B1426B|nr:ABC transporter permease [Actinomadura sp. DC4]MDN3358568.1 ABC transporter permease [Actinomadura sp. DC4]
MRVSAAATLLPVTPVLGVVMAVLVVAAAAVAAVGHLGYGPAVLGSGVRAGLQLTAVSLVIASITRSIPLTGAFVALMYLVAARTAGRRITTGRAAWWAAVPIGAATAPVVALLLATGLVPLRGITIIPITGILIGGALTATSLSGRRAVEELTQRRGEVEAALSVGLPDRDAALEICRQHAATALIPALDQTRTVGLVTLPGAFVGMLLGGASPVAAGAVQLFVLIALLAVESVAIVISIELAARGRFGRPDARRPVRARWRAGIANRRRQVPGDPRDS